MLRSMASSASMYRVHGIVDLYAAERKHGFRWVEHRIRRVRPGCYSDGRQGVRHYTRKDKS
jgi:hypothetical protein